MKIALLGAECTGKTTLAKALVQCMSNSAHVAKFVPKYLPKYLPKYVPEYLREWCAKQQRMPTAQEQKAIAQEQQHRIEAALRTADAVLADTTPLMTAIYSDYLFQDKSLYALALDYQRSFDVTLLTGLDIPWQADGLQRDGPLVREAIDALLRSVLDAEKISYHVVCGQHAERIANALNAINSVAVRALSTSEIGKKPPKSWVWVCDKCSDPDCEHKLFSSLREAS